MEKKIKQAYISAKASKKLRFGLVGVVNTTTDVAILNTLIAVFSLGLIPANIISTACAMLVSFILNKRTVFQSTDPRYLRQLLLFFAVTLIGVWVIQTSVVFVIYTILSSSFSWPLAVDVNIAKVIGILVSMVWNYMWYSRVVFRATTKETE